MNQPIKLDGKAVADEICRNLKYRVDMLKSRNVSPVLTIVTSGEDAASQTYVKNKVRRAEEIGIEADVRHYTRLESCDIKSLRAVQNPIIIQEPITGSLTHNNVTELLSAVFDVDGFSNHNISRIASGREPIHYPCTPKGILRLLDYYNILISTSIYTISRIKRFSNIIMSQRTSNRFLNNNRIMHSGRQ